MLEHLLTPLLKRVEKNLAVSRSLECMSKTFKLSFKLFVVIDFSVECEHKCAVFVLNRLVTISKVNNAKTTEAHGDVVISKETA